MGNDVMDLQELASYLRRDLREVTKLASRGHLPGQKVSGVWRFHRAEINQWLEAQLPEYSEEQLAAVETHDDKTADQQPLVTPLLSEATIAVPMTASTRSSVLQELVRLAEQSWQVMDADALLNAICQREEMGSTALPSGVALPHPRRALPSILGADVLAYGRTTRGIPFGGGGVLTDVFFLIACREARTHLQVLARLARLLRRPAFLEELRSADNPAETLRLIETYEQELIAG